MPLPPALLARLQKRGIVRNPDNEEVIAENYEDDSANKDGFEEMPSGAPGCPNKYNPFHICVKYCYEHWGDGTPEFRIPPRYLANKNRMLARFPLPEGWVEVYDAGLAKFYFWNQDTDEVCWLSPRHPRAYITDPAPRLAKENCGTLFGGGENSRSQDDDRRHYKGRGESSRRGDDDRGRDRDSHRSRDGGSRRDKKRNREEEEDSGNEDLAEMKDRDRLKRAKRKGIDPMDPAAYGDAPVGKWSDGLKVDTATGADVTAGGVLFQQRPYPAPGAILRKQQPPS